MKMTSACANKMLKKLNEDKAYWRNQEQSGYLYTAAENESLLFQSTIMKRFLPRLQKSMKKSALLNMRLIRPM